MTTFFLVALKKYCLTLTRSPRLVYPNSVTLFGFHPLSVFPSCFFLLHNAPRSQRSLFISLPHLSHLSRFSTGPFFFQRSTFTARSPSSFFLVLSPRRLYLMLSHYTQRSRSLVPSRQRLCHSFEFHGSTHIYIHAHTPKNI